jgi:DNA repair photolyase
MFYDRDIAQVEPRRTDVTYLEQPCKSAINPVRGMGFKWSLNPYMGCEHRCTFCYVRAYEVRADRPSDDRYGRSIRVKTNIVAVLRQELSRPRWRPETIVVGAATDPYQPAEGTYRLTRGCLQAFADHSNPAGLITRGPMIVRDIDVLTTLARRADLSINFSIPTLDDEVWRRTEPGTAHPRQRFRALERLAGAGIRVVVAMAPILPGLSDKPEQLAEVVQAARDAGAADIWAGVLHLRDGTRQHFMAALARHWPALVPRYESMYRSGAYLPSALTSGRVEEVRSLKRRLGVADRRTVRLAPPPKPEQLQLLA